MSFFLLSKSADGTLSLLSSDSFDSRQDALSELSRLTSAPEFASWDDEVIVMDVESGTPVLLVRPTTVTVGTADTAPDTAEEVAPDPALVAVIEDLGSEEEPVEPEVAAEPAPVEAESVDEPPAEDVFVAEAEQEPVVEVDQAWAVAVADTENDSLKGALERTAAQMEAEGISAPASVGPETGEGSVPDDVAAAVAVEQTEEIQPTVPETEPDVAEELAEEIATVQEPEVDQEPEGTEEPEVSQDLEGAEGSERIEESPAAEDLPQADQEAAAGEADTAQWPWDTGLSALEEPGLDTESMIRALAEDESSRTVVLGEYDGSDIASTEPELIVSAAATEVVAESAVEFAQPTDEVPDMSSEAVPEVTASGRSEAPAQVEVAAAQDAQPAAVSDFVDLGEVSGLEAKPYEPGEVDISGMTCDDCVYVDTCPNKDERIPSTCGSFQWK